jgi:hypothetical protein
MISTWILVVYLAHPNSNSSGGPLAVENIINQEECLRVQEVFERRLRAPRTLCIEVRKTKP